MSSSDSITTWIGRLKAGEHEAVQLLWEHYFQRLVQLARARLQHAPRAAADEEDVALNAFDSLWRGTQENRFPQLSDRHDLWQLLVMITTRQALELRQHEQRQKRGGGQVRHASALPTEDLAQVLGPEPTPAFAAQVAEECRRRLDGLAEPQLRAVAVAKMEGYSNEEIATRLGCALATVERKLRRIRDQWAGEVDSHE